MDATTAHIDGVQNRIFLDLLAGRGIPTDVRENCASLTDWSFVRDEDTPILSTPIDWIGENYYTVMRIADPSVEATDAIGQDVSMFPGSPPATFAPRTPLTNMGWEVIPEGIELAFRLITDALPGVPIWVCENGIACDDVADATGVHDPLRTQYLDDHIRAVLRSREKGFDVRGYFAWSLMDNLEWASGWTKKFGMTHVDPQTGARTPKDSSLWYRELIASRA